jgi:hypothetical protein
MTGFSAGQGCFISLCFRCRLKSKQKVVASSWPDVDIGMVKEIIKEVAESVKPR